MSKYESGRIWYVKEVRYAYADDEGWTLGVESTGCGGLVMAGASLPDAILWVEEAVVPGLDDVNEWQIEAIEARGNFADAIGQWPGDESDEVIATALLEMS